MTAPDAPTSRRGPASPPWWAALALLLAAFAVVHGPAAWRNLPQRHWEDGRYVRYNRAAIHSVVDVFTKPTAWPGGNEASYRPLSTSLYYLGFRTVFANRPEAYHLFNAALYLGNGLLLFALCRSLAPGWWSLAPPLLFVSRRAHLQVVTYTSEFAALSSTALCLSGLVLFVRGRRRAAPLPAALAVAAFALALLSKETALVWPALLLAWGALFDRPSGWRWYAAPCLVAGAWLLAYPRIVHALYPPDTPGYVLDLAPAAVLSRLAAYALSFVNPLVPPVDPEEAGWAMPPAIEALADHPAAVLPIAVALVGLAAGTVLRARAGGARGLAARVAVLGLAWFAVAAAPFAVVADRLFLRYAYFPHAGLALAAGALVLALERRMAAARGYDRTEDRRT